jgi:hypothetical protein
MKEFEFSGFNDKKSPNFSPTEQPQAPPPLARRRTPLMSPLRGDNDITCINIRTGASPELTCLPQQVRSRFLFGLVAVESSKSNYLTKKSFEACHK